MLSRPSVTGTIDLELPEFDKPPSDPLPLLISWAATAERLGVLEPYNMAIATVGPSGIPTNRFVLAKAFESTGVTFATNSESVKGRQLADNPVAATTIYWRETRQQVRLVGRVELLTPAESDEIWDDRPILSQASSTVSHQSSPLVDDDALHAEAARLAKPGIPLPRPTNWNGYRLVPDSVEFWHGGTNRMHRRLRYERTSTGWDHVRLDP